ncbi:MAG: PAS domain S-box protein [Armatimonadota bacterium]
MTPELSADDGLHFETGRHYCAIFNSDKEWRQCVHAMLRHALARHERFLYLYHNHTPAQIMSCLRRVAGAAAAFASGQALLVAATDVYYPGGRFHSEAILKSGQSLLRQAHDDGYQGVVATGEVCRCQDDVSGGEHFLQYEARLEASLTGRALTCVCQYDRRHLPAEFITEALLVHRYVLCDGRILRNHFYVAPDRYLAEDRAENTLLARLEALREWNEAEILLRDSEQRYRTVADCAYDWECWYSPNDELLYISPSCERISGYTAAEFMADSGLLARIIHPEDRQVVWEHAEHCRKTGEGGEFESRIIRRDGETRWISHCCQPVYSDSGEPLGHRASNRDITGRKLGRLARERLTAELQAVFASLGSPVIVYGSDFRVLHANEQAYYHCGEDLAELDLQALVERLQVRLPSDSTLSVEDLSLDTLLKVKQPLTDEPIRLRDVHGAELRGLASMEPLQIGDEIAGAVLSWNDVTALELSFEQVQAERSTVRQLADELQTVFAALNDCVLVLDKAGTCVRANPAAVRRYGFDPTGLSHQERTARIKILYPDGREYLPDELHTVQALRGNDSEDRRCRFINANGEEFHLLAQAVSLRSGEAVVGAVLSWRDITETERLLESLTETQKQLAASETLYRSIGELIPFGIWVCDPDGKPTHVSESYLAMTGLTLEDLQADFARQYAAGQLPQLLDEWQKHAATGSVWDREFDVTGKDGNTYRILARGIPLFTEDGDLRGWAGSSLDITNRKREQEELQRHRDYLEDLVQQRTAELVEHRERLRLMTSQVALAEERERRRIATAIHDDLSQTLAFAKMRLAALREEPASQALQAGLADLLALMDDAIASSRTLTLELSPPVLYRMGFEPALRWLGAHMASVHGYRVTVHIDKKPKPMGSDLEITLFQSAREMLTNAAKYAACSTVELSLRRHEDTVELTISDDGRGFDPARVKTTVSSGFGLFSIRERLTHLGGELHIEGARGKGCRLVLRVPVKE